MKRCGERVVVLTLKVFKLCDLEPKHAQSQTRQEAKANQYGNILLCRKFITLIHSLIGPLEFAESLSSWALQLGSSFHHIVPVEM